MPAPAFDLDAAIARFSQLRHCRMCGGIVPPAPAVCPRCDTVAIVIPHTEIPREVKRFLCVRAIERKNTRNSEQYLWDTLLLDAYRMEWRGEGVQRVLIRHAATVDEVYPYALADTAAWVAAGYPTTYTL